jgi:hypothetical protein
VLDLARDLPLAYLGGVKVGSGHPGRGSRWGVDAGEQPFAAAVAYVPTLAAGIGVARQQESTENPGVWPRVEAIGGLGAGILDARSPRFLAHSRDRGSRSSGTEDRVKARSVLATLGCRVKGTQFRWPFALSAPAFRASQVRFAHFRGHVCAAPSPSAGDAKNTYRIQPLKDGVPPNPVSRSTGPQPQIAQPDCGSLLTAKLRRSFHEPLHRNGNTVRVASIPAKAKFPASSDDQPPLPLGIPGHRLTGKVASRDSRCCALPHAPEDIFRIARFDGRGKHLHKNLPRLRNRHGKLFDMPMIQRAGDSKEKSSHCCLRSTLVWW